MEANVRELKVPEFRDARGSLVALEELGEIVPFEVKRVYYIFDTPSDYIRERRLPQALRHAEDDLTAKGDR